MKKQSKLQLAKKEYEEVLKIFYEVRKKDVITDFKIRKKGISHQLDLLEKYVIDDDIEGKQRKVQRMLGGSMLDLILEDFENKIYKMPSRINARLAFRKYMKIKNEETKKILN